MSEEASFEVPDDIDELKQSELGPLTGPGPNCKHFIDRIDESVFGRAVLNVRWRV